LKVCRSQWRGAIVGDVARGIVRCFPDSTRSLPPSARVKKALASYRNRRAFLPAMRVRSRDRHRNLRTAQCVRANRAHPECERLLPAFAAAKTDRSTSEDVAAGNFELRLYSEIVSGKAVARCIPTHKCHSTRSRPHSDFRTPVESIGPAPAQSIYCALSDKITTRIGRRLAILTLPSARAFQEIQSRLFRPQVSDKRKKVFHVSK